MKVESANQPLKSLSGVTEEFEVYPDRIEIRSRHGGHNLRSLHFSEVTSVFLTEGTFFVNGFIKLALGDEPEIVFVFDHRFNERARELREVLLDKIGHRDVLPYIHKA